MTTTSLKQVHSSDKILLEITKVQKIYESQGHPKAKDYDDVTQEVLSIAIAIYRCLICTDTPFLDHTKELKFIKIGWTIACKKLDIPLKMMPELVKMVFLCHIH